MAQWTVEEAEDGTFRVMEVKGRVATTRFYAIHQADAYLLIDAMESHEAMTKGWLKGIAPTTPTSGTTPKRKAPK